VLLRPYAAKRLACTDKRDPIKVPFGQNKSGIVLDVEVLLAIMFRYENDEYPTV